MLTIWNFFWYIFNLYLMTDRNFKQFLYQIWVWSTIKIRSKFWKIPTFEIFTAAISLKNFKIIWKCACGYNIPLSNFGKHNNLFFKNSFWDIARNFGFFWKNSNSQKKPENAKLTQLKHMVKTSKQLWNMRSYRIQTIQSKY